MARVLVVVRALLEVHVVRRTAVVLIVDTTRGVTAVPRTTRRVVCRAAVGRRRSEVLAGVELVCRAAGVVAPGAGARGGLVALCEHVAHAEAAPGQAREVLVVGGNLVRVGRVVTAPRVLLVARLPLCALLLLLGLLACCDGSFSFPFRLLGSSCWQRIDLRNFLCAIRFWMRLRSSGSVTSVQSSDLDFCLEEDDDEEDEEECFLELDSE